MKTVRTLILAVGTLLGAWLAGLAPVSAATCEQIRAQNGGRACGACTSGCVEKSTGRPHHQTGLPTTRAQAQEWCAIPRVCR